MTKMPIIVNIKSDTKLQVIGSIVAVLLGTLIGAWTTYWIGKQARNKQREDDEVYEQRLKLRAHEMAIKKASSEIKGILVLVLKNIEHYKDMKKGIITTDGKFRTVVNLPQPYVHNTSIMVDLINISFALKWESFESEVIFQNSIVNEINEYYTDLRQIAHTALLHGDSLNGQVLDEDNRAVTVGAADCIIASESFKERCFVLLAEMELGASNWKKLDFTTITLKELKDYIEKLNKFQPTEKKLTKYIDEEEFRDIYVPKKAFKRAESTIK